MPVELYTLDDVLKVAPKAVECRVKRSTRDGKAKIKLRTKRYLYTYKVDPSQVDEVLSKLGCKKVVDIDRQIAEAKRARAEARRKAAEARKAAKAQAQAAQPAQQAAQAPAQPAQAAQQPQAQEAAQAQPAQGGQQQQQA